MSFLANAEEDYKAWDFMMGTPTQSLVSDRYYHLLNLNYMSNWEMKFAFRDIYSNKWSKWMTFGELSFNSLLMGYDIHRSLLDYEVVVESDYKDYIDNYNASRLIGRILEEKGFSPMYYFSGNKSIHIHIILDKSVFSKIPMPLQLRVMEKLKKGYLFKRRFMEWFREKVISCWDLHIKDFDTSLIKCTHLIRAEGSRNKKGYKTFLGYTYKDITTVPMICNETNKMLPIIGEIRLSNPPNFQEIMEEFLMDFEFKKLKARAIHKEKSLTHFGIKPSNKLRPQVKFILSKEFGEIRDGYHRAMFILCNEVEDINVIKKWRDEMQFDIKDSEIEYRFNKKKYDLSDSFLNDFLSSLGVAIERFK